MPRLVNRPPKYRHHKSTGQAVVSLNGKAIQLGPFGSELSHQRYQKVLEQWRSSRNPQKVTEEQDASDSTVITLSNLQLRRRRGYAITLNELGLVFREHAQAYQYPSIR